MWCILNQVTIKVQGGIILVIVLVTNARTTTIVGVMEVCQAHTEMTMRGQTSGMVVCLTTVNGRTLVIVVVMVEMPQGKTHMNIDREVTVNGVIRLLPGFGMSVVGKLILTVKILFLGLQVFYHLILTF